MDTSQNISLTVRYHTGDPMPDGVLVQAWWEALWSVYKPHNKHNLLRHFLLLHISRVATTQNDSEHFLFRINNITSLQTRLWCLIPHRNDSISHKHIFLRIFQTYLLNQTEHIKLLQREHEEGKKIIEHKTIKKTHIELLHCLDTLLRAERRRSESYLPAWPAFFLSILDMLCLILGPGKSTRHWLLYLLCCYE